MKLIQIQIEVDTENIIKKNPKNGQVTDIRDIKMSIISGRKYTSNIKDEHTAELYFTAQRNTYLRFFAVPKNGIGSVYLKEGGGHPDGCLVGEKFTFDKHGVATAQTVNHSHSKKQAYRFNMELDNLEQFTFSWDPFLSVE